jgi:hypothetical protein
MADTTNKLPEGTDTVIEAGGTGGTGGGAGRSGTTNQGGSTSSASNSTGARTSTTASDSQTDALITGSTAGGTGSTAGGSTGITGSSTSGSTGSLASTGDTAGGSTGSTDDSSSGNSGGIRGIVGNVSTKAKDEVTNRARGLVGESLKSGSNTLGSIANIIEDTVEQIGERLGPQYGDYARTASQTIQRYATSLEGKDPDELVDDARALIRKSPTVAITGAAILGFGLVRLLKAGMPEENSNESRDRQGDRAGTAR